MLECVMNISEGRDQQLLSQLRVSAGSSLLDVHSDEFHHRSVFTLAGADVIDDALSLAGMAVELIDLNRHSGVHPRLGVVDVVPFVPLGVEGLHYPLELDEAVAARQTFGELFSKRFEVPCFFYGSTRSLPEVRRTAFDPLKPDLGPQLPHPTAGACCVGARGVLVAYNVNISAVDLTTTRSIAMAVRSEQVRSLGLALGEAFQVSCNLIDPWSSGIEAAYDSIASEVNRRGGTVLNAELVGLVPEAILHRVHRSRWTTLGLTDRSSIESRLGSSSNEN